MATTNSHFRRGQSKVYYASDVWDPGEELARTSFRSSCSEDEMNCSYGNNEDYVASLMRRRNADKSIYEDEEEEEAEEFIEDEEHFALPTYAKPLPLLGHPSRHSVLNRSAELDDILEEESDDENSSSGASPAVISSPSSNSPDGSFRLPNSRRNQEQTSTDSTSSASSTDGRVGTPPPPNLPTKTKSKQNRSSNNLQSKSHDSGFSDSAASDSLPCNREDRATSSQSTSKIEDSSEEELKHDNKKYHVSKVYFYSVSDVLQNSEPIEVEQEQHHVSILDCETGRVRRGFVDTDSPILLQPPISPPPPAPPLSHRINVSSDSDDIKLDPLACDMNFYDGLLEHKPLPMKIGSLGRSSTGSMTSPTSPCTSCRSPSQFPKTNGSLYESLSLGRRCHCDKRKTPRSSSSSNEDCNNVTMVSSVSPASVSLPSPAWTGTAYDSFDDPLSGSRRSFRSISDLSLSSSSGPTSPWGQQTQQTTSSTYEKAEHYSSPPSSVVFWLRELCLVHEAECTIMLQSKPVGGSNNADIGISAAATYNQSHMGNFWAGNSKDTIRAIQSRAHAISAVFAKLCKQLGHKGTSKLVSLVQGLSHQVHLFLVEYNKVNHLQLNLPGFKPRVRANLGNAGPENVPEDILHQQRLLLQSCDRLKLTVSRNQPQSEVVDVITQLGATFTKLIELMLSKEIKASVDSLDDVKNDTLLKGSVDNIITLALEGNHLCRLIAKHGGVRSLLTICVDPKKHNVRVNAFRALGTVCCVLEGIMELEDAGGVEILSDTLKDDRASEEEKSEAAGLLAQVTSPWIENNNTIEGLSRHLNDLVQSLTSLSGKTTSAETFLLSTAALANLTFMEPSVVPLLRTYNTAKVLVTAINKQQGHQRPKRPLTVSIYIQDQVAAVLANMAANVECRSEVVKHGGLPLLLQFLLAQSSAVTSSDLKPEDYAQIAATERVLQKSAIAISRLCNDKRLAEEVVRLEGLGRLVELCKNESARVGSDGVLVACLAAVRKIAAAVGPEKFKNLDATELVEPRLLDSFLIFSSRNESFV